MKLKIKSFVISMKIELNWAFLKHWRSKEKCYFANSNALSTARAVKIHSKLANYSNKITLLQWQYKKCQAAIAPSSDDHRIIHTPSKMSSTVK